MLRETQIDKWFDRQMYVQVDRKMDRDKYLYSWVDRYNDRQAF